MTIEQIVSMHLREHGYNGLFNADGNCACKIGSLFACDGLLKGCRPGYLKPCDCGEHDFHITCDKPTGVDMKQCHNFDPEDVCVNPQCPWRDECGKLQKARPWGRTGGMTKRQIEARAKKQLKAAAWIKPGVLVDYHGIIDGPVTAPGCHVTHKPYILAGHTAVVMLAERGDVVSVDALTPAVTGG